MTSRFEIRVPGISARAVFGFESPSGAMVVRGLVEARVSGARLPTCVWSPTGDAPQVQVELMDLGDVVRLRFSGVVETPSYVVDKVGLHWDFGKVLTALVLPQALQQRVVALHAATVCWGEGPVMIAGASGAGKSSLTFASLAQGARVLASELSFVAGRHLVAGNASLTIDASALSRFGLSRPEGSSELDGRVVFPIPEWSPPSAIARLAFPRVGHGELAVRSITHRRARMLLFENAISQLPMSSMVAHETHPIGPPASAADLLLLADAARSLAELSPVILEGPPDRIAEYLSGSS